jgi:hypothetical protein
MATAIVMITTTTQTLPKNNQLMLGLERITP